MRSEAIRTYFDTHARQFDGLYGAESRRETILNRALRQAVYERFTITLAESGEVRGAAILDVGCGPGRYALAYADLGAGRVVGIDVAEKMIALARRHAEVAEVSDRCRFICGDFLATDLADRFDVVLAVGVFDYLSAPVPFLRRMVDLSGGKVIATFPGRSLLRMRLRRLRYAVRGVPVHFYHEGEVRDLARAAGLRTFKLIFIRSSGTGYVLVGSAGSL